MRTPRRSPPALAVVVIIMTIAAVRAWGSDPPHPVPIQYTAPDACPQSPAFLDEVRRRTSRVDIVAAQQADLVIVIREIDGKFVGSLQRLSGDSDSADRHLEAASCTEVASALALVVALTLDPSAISSPWPSASASGAAAASDSAAPPLPPRQEKPSPRMVDRVLPPAIRPREPPQSPRYRWWVGAQGLLASAAIAPGVTPGGSLFIEVQSTGIGWTPTLRLGGYYAGKQVGDDTSGARIRWYGGRLDGCPIALGPSDWMHARPCVGFSLGALHGEGEVDSPNQDTRWWADLQVSLRLQAHLTTWLAVEGQAALIAPLTRYTYDLRAPDRQLYEVPRLGGQFGIGLAATFF